MSNAPERLLQRIPWGIILCTVAIACIGALNLSSAAKATRPDLYVLQLAYVGVAAAVAAVIVRIRTYVFEALAWPIYVVVCVLLVVVLVAGTTIKGSQRWIDLGFFNLQPSELAKIAVILAMARYLSRFRVLGGYTLRALFMPLNLSRPVVLLAGLLWRWHEQAEHGDPADPTWLKALAITGIVVWALLAVLVLVRRGVHYTRIVAPIDVVAVPFVLILVEPDLGTSLILLAIAGVQVLFCGVRKGSLFIAMGLAIFAAVLAWTFVLHDYQKRRVETFLNPEADVQGAGYHATQSKIAIGSGMLTGKGHGEGTQTQLSFLPENHTDFVFSVLAEEWGFVGAVTLLLLFLALILLILQNARQHPERFAVLVNVGAAAMIFWHVLINIGMVTGLLPVVGVTLPLMSYGGSNLITQVAAIALAINTRIWRRT